MSLLFVAGACDESLERPTGLPASTELELEVHLLSPDDGQSVLSGDSVLVRVHGQESSGRVAGLGFRAQGARAGQPALAVDLIEFESGLVADSTLDFRFLAPDTLPDHMQLDIRGVVLGADRVRHESQPVRITVLHCPASAAWC